MISTLSAARQRGAGCRRALRCRQTALVRHAACPLRAQLHGTLVPGLNATGRPMHLELCRGYQQVHARDTGFSAACRQVVFRTRNSDDGGLPARLPACLLLPRRAQGSSLPTCRRWRRAGVWRATTRTTGSMAPGAPLRTSSVSGPPPLPTPPPPSTRLWRALRYMCVAARL
jgi:hypothetical protein